MATQLPAIITPPREPLVDPRTGIIARSWFLFFQQIQRNNAGVSDADVVTLTDAQADFPNSRVLEVTAGDLTKTTDATDTTLGLATTGITAGSYGSAAFTISGTVDAKGRWSSITAHALSTTNVAEGTNLYFTNARARSALSGAGQINYNSTTGVIDTTGPDLALSGGVVTSLTTNNGVVTAGTLQAAGNVVLADPVTSLVVVGGVVTGATGTTGFTGTVTPVTSITVANGIVTAVS